LEEPAAEGFTVKPRGGLLAALLLFAAHAAHSEIVRACESDAQTNAGMNLATALLAGGLVQFACPAGTVIKVTSRYAVGQVAIIGSSITLDGQGVEGTFLSTGSDVTLRDLTLVNFRVRRPVFPGRPQLGREQFSVINGAANIQLENVTVRNSEDSISGANITATDSTFTDNGDALLAGSAMIWHCHFARNSLGVSIASGWIRSSEFTGHTSSAVDLRGGTAALEVRGSIFTVNTGEEVIRASERAARGGTQTMTLRANTFRGNATSAGVITVYDPAELARRDGLSPAVVAVLASFPPAQFELAYNRFDNNKGGPGSAIQADLTHGGPLNSTGDLFIENTAAGDGGAVLVHGGNATLNHALFSGNRATGRGAALFSDGAAAVTVANSLVIRNSGPQGALTGQSIALINDTIADNDAAGLAPDAAAQVSNSVFARNHPADCSGVAAGSFAPKNAASDGSCPGIAPSEPFLDAFYIPVAGSPLLGAGDPAVCAAVPVGGVDLLFQPRPASRCALGAFEAAPVRPFSYSRRPAAAPPPHATTADDFPDDEGYRPPPGEVSTSCPAWTSDAIRDLAGVRVDYSVTESDLRDWLGNCRFTPYPAIARALLGLLRPRPLRQNVYLDVIVWQYEHTPGAASPRNDSDIVQATLQSAVVSAFNERYGTMFSRWEDVLQ
jgi:predicted outer membrane repeat protein